MKSLIIKIKVKDNIDAYRAVSRLGFMFEIEEAEFDSKVYKFSKTDKTRLPKLFLRDDFGKKSISEKK